jgi:hypothetical protein
LRGAVRVATKQEDEEDNNMCVIIFLAKRSHEDNSSVRIKPRRLHLLPG